MKNNLTKEKIFKYLVLAYFIISPIFDLVFLYKNFSTLMRVFILGVFVVITLILYKDSRKKFMYLLAFYLAMLGYLCISYFHANGFTSFVPNASYSIINEATTIIKLCMPFTILFILKYQNLEKKNFWRVINAWIIIIAGSIVLTNLLGYSLSSYTNEITRYSIFSWGSDLTVNETATKGFFTYANQVSNVLSMLLVLVFYEVTSNKNWKLGSVLLCISCLAMIMLGTRLSTYGGLLILGGLCLFYFGYSKFFKKKISKSFIVPVVLVVCWIAFLPIAPCNSRMQEIANAKVGSSGATDQVEENMNVGNSLDIDEEQKTDEDLLFIEQGINTATIGKQFYLDYYPYKYDMDFWRDIVSLQQGGQYIDYRRMEMLIAKRLWEVDYRWTNVLFGISNSRMQNVTNIERDFILHYYTFGLVGALISLSFYIYMLIELVKRVFKDFSFWNISILGCLGVFLLGSYMTGNSLNFLATIVPCAFVVCSKRYDELY